MAYDLLKGLQPEVFFKWFGAVSEVPRGSRKEGRFIAFLEEFARARGLACETDEAGNVLMRVPASPGYEAEPLLLLQAHMDMVWASEPGLNFDFEHSAIPMKIEDGLLRGKGTTLGADNGVGLAAMLAVADSSDIPHPELECLFTVTEEIGLHGIRQFDCGKLRARRMINMDCGDSHVVAVSSAGSAKMAAGKTFARIDAPEGMTALRIEVKGLTGGHSGLTIDRGSACAANAMGLLLEGISDCGALLLRIRSSERPILKSCLAEVLVPAKWLQKALACLEETAGKLKKRYAATDPGMEIEFLETALPAGAKALSEADSQAAVGALLLMKTGPYRFKESDRSVIIMSGSIGKVLLEDGVFQLSFSIRSSDDLDKEFAVKRYQRLMRALGFDLELLDSYTGWPEREDSPFRDLAVRMHERLFGYAPALERVHGGIEVGMIVGAIPEMDSNGFSPTSRGAHSTEERLYISEVAPFWEWMKAILAEKSR